MKFAALLFCTALCASSVAAQQVLVVDAASGAPFSDVQTAIGAARPGDTVLVRPGSYGSVSITRDIALVADGVGIELASLAITGLPAGATALVHGFRLARAPIGANGVTVEVSGCDGEVWIQDCDLDGSGSAFPSLLGGGGLRIANCSDVTLVNNVSAVIYLSPFAETESAIDIDASTVHMYGGSVSGPPTPFNAATAAIRASDSTVVLHDVTVTGGFGTSTGNPGGICTDGGAGIVAEGVSAIISVGSRVIGGPPPPLCFGGSPTPGPATVLRTPATMRTISSAPLRLVTQTVARETQNVDYAVAGSPGDALVLAFALRPDAFFLELIRSSLLVGPSFIGIPVGSLSASGAVTIPTVVRELGPGVDVVRFYVQLLALRANATLVGGSGYALTLLDRSL